MFLEGFLILLLYYLNTYLIYHIVVSITTATAKNDHQLLPYIYECMTNILHRSSCLGGLDAMEIGISYSLFLDDLGHIW